MLFAGSLFSSHAAPSSHQQGWRGAGLEPEHPPNHISSLCYPSKGRAVQKLSFLFVRAMSPLPQPQ